MTTPAHNVVGIKFEVDTANGACVFVRSGPFDGVCVELKAVDDGSGKCNGFRYTIIENPTSIDFDEDDENQLNLDVIVGNIVATILEG